MILEDPVIKEPKTKDFAETLKKLKIDNKVSIIWSGDRENFVKSTRNIPGVFLVNSNSLGAYDILKTSKIIFIKEAVSNVQERLKK
jgi:large subunit ribosomal protein L4